MGSVHFFPFSSVPQRARKKPHFFLLSPTSGTVTFFADYHRNILSISLFCEEGETRVKGRNGAFFVRSSFLPASTPFTHLTNGVTIHLESPKSLLFVKERSYSFFFDQISVSAANTLTWFVCLHTFSEKQEKKDSAYSLNKI